jgi:hypothetical protein
MRYILLLLIALVLTITWQSTVLATVDTDRQPHCAADTEGKDKKSGGNDEPECE